MAKSEKITVFVCLFSIVILLWVSTVCFADAADILETLYLNAENRLTSSPPENTISYPAFSITLTGQISGGETSPEAAITISLLLSADDFKDPNFAQFTIALYKQSPDKDAVSLGSITVEIPEDDAVYSVSEEINPGESIGPSDIILLEISSEGGADEIRELIIDPYFENSLYGPVSQMDFHIDENSVLPPLIISHPEDFSIMEGLATNFYTKASGLNLSYQWQRDGQDIPGATSSMYSLSPVALSDANSEYRCTVSNAGGKITSDTAILAVSERETLYETLYFSPGNHLSPFPSESSVIYYNDSQSNFSKIFSGKLYYGNTISGAPVYMVLLLNAGDWRKPTIGEFIVRLEKNKIPLGSASVEIPEDYVNHSVTLSIIPNQSIEPQDNIEILVYSDCGVSELRCLSSGLIKINKNINNVYEYSAIYFPVNSNTLLPPQIISHPKGITVMEGMETTFSVKAVGAELVYQWQENEVDIPGAYDPDYTIKTALLSDSMKDYRCIVSNPNGSVTSETAILKVLPQVKFLFERMWPTLQQPWYFSPIGIASDGNGNIYIADLITGSIQKFTSDGQFITRWGSFGKREEEYSSINDIAIDRDGNIYVLDRACNNIVKFTSDGVFINKWGSFGDGNSEFDSPTDMAIDGRGDIYVADTFNHRIQKFTSDGKFIKKWGIHGEGDGEFDSPEGIAIDRNGNVYVADTGNQRIQKFTSDGQFIEKWGEIDSGIQQFECPRGIALDAQGNVYVTDSWNCRINKFTSKGGFIAQWGEYGEGSGQFHKPSKIAIDKLGNVYITDAHRIQKFTSEGKFLAAWGSSGSWEGMFNQPQGIITDSKGDVYVVDSANKRIQKFTSDGRFIEQWVNFDLNKVMLSEPKGIAVDEGGNMYLVDSNNNCIVKLGSNGEFILQWGSYGTGEGMFIRPEGIAADGNGYVYVTDSMNNRIQKFTTEGRFINQWGGYGSNEGEFNSPEGIAVDGMGNVYVADTSNHRIQVFTQEGKYITKWGKHGTNAGEFKWPVGIALDENGHLYVIEQFNNRVQIFTSSGYYLTTIGEIGTNPGMFYFPTSLCIGRGGRIYVSDTGNNRVQVFRRVTIYPNNKAIIVAGGGPYQGNILWDATRMAANFAYRTLTCQGFTNETIYYLSEDKNVDLNGNGVLDDVDADSDNDNLHNAITHWSVKEPAAENLFIYMVDHGGENSFRMSGTEVLPAFELHNWLNELQQAHPCKVTLIYEACKSGSFIGSLKAGAGGRTVITSTSEGESAYFITQGTISFSNFFWTHIFTGTDIYNAFTLARDSMHSTTRYQNAMIDADGDGIGNELDDDLIPMEGTYIGNGTILLGDAPVIGGVAIDQNVIIDQNIACSGCAAINAFDVTDANGIARVWAVIRSPDYGNIPAHTPVHDLPFVDLLPVSDEKGTLMSGETGHFRGIYRGLTHEGTYHVAVYARDRVGNTSMPVITTIDVDNPLTHKAIIVGGGAQQDLLWPIVESNLKIAFEALRFQGYADEDIYIISPASIPGVADTVIAPTLDSLQYAISRWAAQNARDLVIYLTGAGDNGIFYINDTQILTASSLDKWLDILQGSMSLVTVIYDGCKSGSFLTFLIPPQERGRIVIASTRGDQPAYFNTGTGISFSSFFWRQVLNGADIRKCFESARDSILFMDNRQTPQLDDNGNGIGNERDDFLLSSSNTIGTGIQLAADPPVIENICPDQYLTGSTETLLWVENIVTTDRITHVYAEIIPPGYPHYLGCGQSTGELSVVSLEDDGTGRYECTYEDFCIFGEYIIHIYAEDSVGNISMPKRTRVFVLDSDDAYEIKSEDAMENARVITLNDIPERHNLHEEGDQDWVKFYGIADIAYTIAATNPDQECDPVILLYDANGILIESLDNYGPGQDEEINWSCKSNGIYYVMITQSRNSTSGSAMGYDLGICNTTLPGVLVLVTGMICDAVTEETIEGAQIITDMHGSAISMSDGTYLMFHPSGTFTFTVSANAYTPVILSGIFIPEAGSITLENIELERLVYEGDSDRDTDNDGIDEKQEDGSDDKQGCFILIL